MNQRSSAKFNSDVHVPNGHLLANIKWKNSDKMSTFKSAYFNKNWYTLHVVREKIKARITGSPSFPVCERQWVLLWSCSTTNVYL